MARQSLSPEQRQRRIRRVLWIEGASDVFFLVVKTLVGLNTGSAAVLTDAVHSLTDLANNVVALILLRVAEAPPDREHPYGHHKYETLAVFTIAVVITAMAVQVVVSAVTRARIEVIQSPVSLAMMCTVLVVNIGFTGWEHLQAQQLDSDLLRADARHTLSDVALTVAVIAGWQLAAAGHAWIDTTVAVVVAVFVLYLAYALFRRSVPVLVDHIVVEPEELAAVVGAVAGVADVRRVRSHQAGSQKLIDIVVSVDGALSTSESHAIADAIEEAVRQRVGEAQINIHIEPLG